MDVDNDLDGQLLQQFSSLGTTDKEVLIAEFQKLLGNQLNPAGCAFFLDMNNWNLQAAICAYYDFDQPSVKLPQLMFIRDVTIGEGESVPPNTTFTKTWQISNSELKLSRGKISQTTRDNSVDPDQRAQSLLKDPSDQSDEPWPPGCQLKFCTGENLALTDRAVVSVLQPGETTDVSVNMESGSAPGVFQSQWRMCTATGMFFGEPIWVIVTVAEGGVLAVTQQLSKFGSDFVNTHPQQNVPNPFGSPTKDGDETGVSGVFLSPSNSLVAQQGSPYLSQLSPSPPHQPQQQLQQQPDPNSALARSLFPVNGAMDGSSSCDNSSTVDEEMS